MAKHGHRRSRKPAWWLVLGLVAVLAVTGGLAAAAVMDDDAEAPNTPGTADGAEKFTYVALGDSYTSAPWVPETDPEDPCLRSSGNYPNLAAAQLPDVELVDASCGGATTESMQTPQELREGKTNESQFEALHEDVDLVTLGIGFNNYDLFELLVYDCLEVAEKGRNCHDTSLRGPQLKAVISDIEAAVMEVVDGVKQRSPDADVVLVPYPKIFPDVACPDTLPFSGADLAYINEVNQSVSKAQMRAAKKSGAGSVDVYQASIGHDICSAEPWVQGAKTDTEAAASYHPLAVEQKAVADLIVAEVCANSIPC